MEISIHWYSKKTFWDYYLKLKSQFLHNFQMYPLQGQLPPPPLTFLFEILTHHKISLQTLPSACLGSISDMPKYIMESPWGPNPTHKRLLFKHTYHICCNHPKVLGCKTDFSLKGQRICLSKEVIVNTAVYKLHTCNCWISFSCGYIKQGTCLWENRVGQSQGHNYDGLGKKVTHRGNPTETR